MSKPKGYIKLYRSMMKNFLWEDKPFSKGQAWIDLLLMAHYTTRTVLVRKGKTQAVAASGEVITTEKELSRKWGWSRNKVRRFLSLLVDKGQVEQLKTHLFTRITIRYWEEYQETGQLTQKRNNSTPKTEQLKDSETEQLTEQLKIDINDNIEADYTSSENETEQLTEQLKDTETEQLTTKNGHLLNNNKNNIIIIMSPDEEEVIRSLARVPGYPLDRKTDLELYHDLEKEYPKADVVEAIKSWSIAKIDKPLSKKSNPRLQIRNWLKKGFEEFGKYRKKEVIEEKPSTGKALHRDDIENFRRTYKAFLEESPNQAKGYAMRIKLTYGYDPSQEEELCQK